MYSILYQSFQKNHQTYALKEILQAGLDESENQQMGVLLSSLLFQMVKHWTDDLKESSADLVGRLDRLLVSTYVNVENSSPRMQLAILGSTLHLVQANEEGFDQYGSSLLRTLGSLIQASLRASWSPHTNVEGLLELHICLV